MKPAARWALFAGFLGVAMIALLPARLAGLERAGVTARAATGTIWNGRLEAARLGDFELGDVRVALRPLALFVGNLQMAFAGDAISGRFEKHRDGFGVAGVTGRLGALQIGGFPVTSVEFDAVEIGFSAGGCDAAAGQIKVQPAIGRFANDRLVGAPRCDANAVVLPLASPSGQERLDMRIDAEGRFRSTFAIDGATEAERAALLVTGFKPTPTGLAITMEGSI